LNHLANNARNQHNDKTNKQTYNNTYSNKINAEYEEIKKSILQKATTSSDTLNAYKFNTNNYDSLRPIDQGSVTEPIVYKFEDLGIHEKPENSNVLSRSMIETSDIFDEILKQVERCTSQAEELDKLDEVEVSYAIYDDKLKNATEETLKTPTNENGRLEFMPFYQVSEELIIEESFNLKKNAEG